MASQTPSVVARRIAEIRVAKRLSRQKLADLVNVADPKAKMTYLRVYRLETGVIEATAEHAALFANALHVPVASLYREAS